MTQLKTFGVPTTGQGIIHPNLDHRFRVEFFDLQDQRLSFSDKLTSQVIAVERPEYYNIDDLNISGWKFKIKFEDDIVNNAHSGIHALKDSEFNVVVSILDGCGNVLRKELYQRCTKEHIKYSVLDYANSGKYISKRLTLSVPQKFSALLDSLRADPTINAIVETLEGSKFSFEEYNDRSQASSIEVDFSCESLAYSSAH